MGTISEHDWYTQLLIRCSSKAPELHDRFTQFRTFMEKLKPPPEFYEILRDHVIHHPSFQNREPTPKVSYNINQQLVALMCGTHPRLGIESPVSIIGCVGVRHIVEIIKDAHRIEEQNARFRVFTVYITKVFFISWNDGPDILMIMRNGLRQYGYEPFSNPQCEKMIQYCKNQFDLSADCVNELKLSLKLIYEGNPDSPQPFKKRLTKSFSLGSQQSPI